MSRDLFDIERLPPALDGLLRGEMNPWWEGRPGRVLPSFQRSLFPLLLRHLQEGMAPAVMLRGPRQVGKTTLQEQIIQYLLASEKVNPHRILRVQFDDLKMIRGMPTPILSICRWFQERILEKTFNQAAHERQPAYLFFDEVQNLREWAPQIKSLVDHNTVRAMITGSSALRIQAGQDSLAGRVNPLELGPLSLREIAKFRFNSELPVAKEINEIVKLKKPEFWERLRDLGRENHELRNQAFSAFSELGGYPVAQKNTDWSWEDLADFLNKTVVQRAVIHDLRLGEKGRKRNQQLLEEVFKLACRYAGQAPGPSGMVGEIQKTLQSDVSWERIRHYLRFLDETLLIKLIPPLELNIKRKKGFDKICLCDPMIRSSWLQEPVPLDPAALARNPNLSVLAGRLAESVTGYFLASLVGGKLFHFPARGDTEPEVDYVLTVGDLRIPFEVKYQNQITDSETRGLRSFLERTTYNATFGVLVTKIDEVNVRDPRIITLPLSSLMLLQ